MKMDVEGKVYGKWTVVREYKEDQYWYVDAVCACGVERRHRRNKLVGGRVNSCPACRGIMTYWHPPKIYSDIHAFREVYSDYKSKAKNRAHCPFELTIEEFRDIARRDCFYCGEAPTNVKNPPKKSPHGNPYIYNGIDRVVPAEGYVWGNVVPCCKYCNRAKSDQTFEEYRHRCGRVVEKFRHTESLNFMGFAWVNPDSLLTPKAPSDRVGA